MYEYDVGDPNLDFNTANAQVARALKQAAALKNQETPGLVRDGRGNLYFSRGAAVGNIANRLAGALDYEQAERQERVITAEERRRFADLSKQLVTPGAKKAKVLKQTLVGPVDPNNPNALMSEVQQDVPLSPEEENQRQMAVGAQLLGLPMGKFMGQEAVRSGMMFPEKMAELRMRQQQAAQLQAERLQAQREMEQQRQENRIFLKTLAGVGRGGGRAGAVSPNGEPQVFAGPATVVGVDPDGNEIRRINKTGQLFTISPETGEYRAHSGATQPKPSTAAVKNAKEANAGIAGIDDALKSIKDNPQALGLINALPFSETVRQYTDPEGIATRAKVANIGSLKIHDRSGAAVSAAEFPRLRPFIPQQSDSPEAAKKKLEDLKAEYGRMRAEWSQAGTKPVTPDDKSSGLPKAAGKSGSPGKVVDWKDL